MYKLTLYVPQSEHEAQLNAVKDAMFAAGAGEVGNYSHCCWQVLGMGQFQPLVGSNPHIGQHGQLETVAEWRVECVVADNCIDAVITAMKKAHPYETPAYDVVTLQRK